MSPSGNKLGSEEAEILRVSAAWMKWTDLFGVLCDKKVARKLKIKLYIAVIRPVPLYATKCWTVRKKQEHTLEKTEIGMSRGIKGVTKDIIASSYTIIGVTL